jgi:nucleoid DNA-binding protein
MSNPSALTKRDLINQVAAVLEGQGVSLTKKAIDAIIGQIFAAVKSEIVDNGKCNINSFGTFEVRNRAARKGISPRTREEIDIPASKTVGLRASKKLKETLNA